MAVTANITRRGALSTFSLAGLLAASGSIAAPVAPTIEQLADELAKALAAKHGGVWKLTLDHRYEFVMVVKKVERKKTA